MQPSWRRLQAVKLGMCIAGMGREAAAPQSKPGQPGLQQLLSELQGPVCAHLLPHLYASEIAALRATCRSARDCIDSADPRSLFGVVFELLPEPLWDYAVREDSGARLQKLLRQQQRVLADIRTGREPEIRHLKLPDSGRLKRLLWNPVPGPRGEPMILAAMYRPSNDVGPRGPCRLCFFSLMHFEPFLDSTSSPWTLQVSDAQWSPNGAHLLHIQVRSPLQMKALAHWGMCCMLAWPCG